MPDVYISSLKDGYYSNICRGIDWLGLSAQLHRGQRVFLKPNLTFPVFRKGVMTTPECVEAAVRVFCDLGCHVVVGEADSGGYNRFNIDEVFRATGLLSLVSRYGIRVVNLSRLPHRVIQTPDGVSFPFPELLLDEIDLFVSLPVPKIHMNTYLSGAVKNLWGCIPHPESRLRLHPSIDRVLLEITRRLLPAIAIVDGRYGLNVSGPMSGEAVDLNWMMLANDLYAAEVAVAGLLQVESRKVCYLRYAQRQGMAPALDQIRFSQPYEQYCTSRFYLKRKATDWPGLLAFHSTTLAYLAYHSPIAGLLHKLLYLVRKPFYDYSAARAGYTR